MFRSGPCFFIPNNGKNGKMVLIISCFLWFWKLTSYLLSINQNSLWQKLWNIVVASFITLHLTLKIQIGFKSFFSIRFVSNLPLKLIVVTIWSVCNSPGWSSIFLLHAKKHFTWKCVNLIQTFKGPSGGFFSQFFRSKRFQNPLIMIVHKITPQNMCMHWNLKGVQS